jgi:tetratricopeptide (TPR) repeat protein
MNIFRLVPIGVILVGLQVLLPGSSFLLSQCYSEYEIFKVHLAAKEVSAAKKIYTAFKYGEKAEACPELRYFLARRLGDYYMLQKQPTEAHDYYHQALHSKMDATWVAEVQEALVKSAIESGSWNLTQKAVAPWFIENPLRATTQGWFVKVRRRYPQILRMDQVFPTSGSFVTFIRNLYNRGQANDALLYLQQAFSRYPHLQKDRETLELYGRILLSNKNYPKSIAVLKPIYDRNPQLSSGYYLARAYELSHRKNAAIQTYQGVTRHGTGSLVPSAYARLLRLLPPGVERSKTVHDLISRHPSSEQVVQLHWERAFPAITSRRWDVAWVHLSAIHTSGSFVNNAKYLYWQGVVLRKLGRPNEAEMKMAELTRRYNQSFYRYRAENRPFPPQAKLLPLDPGRRSTERPDIVWLISQNYFDEAIARLKLAEDQKAIEELPLLFMQKGDYYQAICSIQSLIPITTTQDVFCRTYYPLAFDGTIRQYSADYAIDPFLVLSVIRAESMFKPQAVSWAAARGLMQIIQPTGAEIARQLKLKRGEWTLDHPETNIRFGTYYLAGLMRQYPSPVLALAAYNAGPGAVKRWRLAYGFTPDDPDLFIEQIPYPETQGYVKRVLSNYWAYQDIY